MSKSKKASTPDYQWAECASCGGPRKCDIHGHFLETGNDAYVSWRKDWFILQCRGCTYTFVQTVATNEEDYTEGYDENGEDDIQYTETLAFWPALSKRARPDWVGGFGPVELKMAPLHSALRELYSALEADLRMLAAVGIRTVFDVASELLGVETHLNFAQKLEKLVEMSHIGGVDQKRLSTLVDAGSAAAHRGWVPSASELDAMVDALEHFIERAFIAPIRQKALDERMADLRKGVPVRRRARPKRPKQTPPSADEPTPRSH